ncbi:MAG TPA: hypothetical protein VHO28_12535 [Ignavibacteriales bacterium]|nr:hypothetical protein [Ignavibacteriales bacterium]
MIKRIAAILLLASGFALAQAEYVEYNHPVYDLLERAASFKIISGYNSFERPLDRKKIAEYLSAIEINLSRLNAVDREILKDYQSEFEYELHDTLTSSVSLIGGDGYNLFSQKEKYLYAYAEKGKASLFVNLLANGEYLYYRDLENNSNKNLNLGYYGGSVRGTLLDKFSFYLKGTNGISFGNKELAQYKDNLRYNYKINENSADGGTSEFYDETEGYFAADFDYVKFKLGSDRNYIGNGIIKEIMGAGLPKFNYVNISLNYKIFSFNYIHGQLLGSRTETVDSAEGIITSIAQKYLVYHRLGINLPSTNIGIGEMIVYSKRSLDLGYLNPLNFYKSVEHANQDRDNSLLFLDISHIPVSGLKLYGSINIDDIDFAKLGEGWYGNKILYNAGFFTTLLYNIAPIDIGGQYLHIDPYVYSHRIFDNNVTNSGYSLIDPLQPNSENLVLRINYYPMRRLRFRFDGFYGRHGANPLNADGSVMKNVGGNVLVGHRVADSEKVDFLDGDLEYLRRLTLTAIYEPIKGYSLEFSLKHINDKLQNGISHKYLLSALLINLKL